MFRLTVNGMEVSIENEDEVWEVLDELSTQSVMAFGADSKVVDIIEECKTKLEDADIGYI